MTSEGPHHPGQQPDEVSPGTGAPAPYGVANPDLGWAPPPPAARPSPPAPAWAAQQNQPPTAAWGAAPPQNDQPPTQAWGAAQTPGPQPGEPGAWGPQPTAAAQPAWAQSDQPAWAPGEQGGPAWGTAQPAANGAAQPAWGAAQPEQPAPAWTGVAEQPPPAWGQAEPAVRGAARVPAPASLPQDAWNNQDDPARSGGWPAGQGGGQPTTSAWPAADEPGPTGAWGGAPVPPPQDTRPDKPDWASAEPTSVPPARTTATAGVDGPPAWGAPGSQQPWSAERPAVPDVEPWAPGEAWGRTEAEPAAPQQAGGWEPGQPEDRPLYQPAPAPGISPANAVPLPPQEQRVPGASLAGAPPADYLPPAQFTPSGEPPARSEQPGPESTGVDAGWGRTEEPQPPAGPVVPTPRVSAESGAAARAAVPVSGGEVPAGGAGSVSASASVPMASRVMPPADQPVHPGGTPTPQPRVYGRPARPESVDEPAQVEEHGFHADHNPPPPRYEDPAAPGRYDDAGTPGRYDDPGAGRFDDPGSQGRFDDRGPQRFDEPQQHGFGEQQGFGEQHGFGDGPGQQHGFGDGPGVAPPAFPPGVPSFADPVPSNRPMNGTRPHGGSEHPGEHFGGPGPSAGGGTAVHGAVPAPGPNPFGEPDHGGYPPGGPHHSGPPQAAPAWGAEPEQNRFDAFKPEAGEPKTEAPTPKVRNGRVLAVVLLAAVLILAVPLGLLFLLGKVGGDEKPAGFNPAVGSCVKRSGDTAAAATCGEAGSFTVVSRVANKDKCADPGQPYVVLPGSGADRVLCLKPAGK
ncbi:hypothetical protein ACFY2R_00685 [Micromonospora olivasterospora]|uniref:Uncharacterized protein n=1 Tax=Micromonospora olivasterospora TaxID=1880 RepID=A0A562I992_MICOL|nr:hypothetical protein [Micromonospora olivasterospora]TWH67589.1 hypothetical protein JD77_02569 [Micromonospora olivasterospora]